LGCGRGGDYFDGADILVFQKEKMVLIKRGTWSAERGTAVPAVASFPRSTFCILTWL
jgi:hypothetical protein